MRGALLLAAILGGCDSGGAMPDFTPPRCDVDGDCSDPGAPYCHVASHTCVACLVSGGCPQGKVCGRSGFGPLCQDACATASDCVNGSTGCCNGVCVDLVADRTNCGRCGTACGGNLGCFAGSCGCGASGPDRCGEYCTSFDGDPMNCGGCGRHCPAQVTNGWSTCVKGQCVVGGCSWQYADCDHSPDNGCELSVANDPLHCGRCDNECKAIAHGAVACFNGRCDVAGCEDGFGDCNRDPADGCEADLTADPKNCGVCGHRCGVGQACVGGGKCS